MPSFRDIPGQNEAVSALREELSRNRASHAYLLEGAVGTGRLSLARALAAAVMCESDGVDACGECKACRMLEAGSHPDYLEMSREESLLKISQFVRREGESSGEQSPALEFLYRKPMMARRSICVIPDAERMNEAAANAFLKTLEEPPGGALIILTTSARDRLLATIVSRCRRVSVRPLPTELIAKELVRKGCVEEAEAMAVALIAEGSLGEAIKLSESEASETWSWINNSLKALTPVGAVNFAEGLIERTKNAGSDGSVKRAEATRLLDMLSLAVRRSLRGGLNPLAAEKALGAIWNAGEQVGQNVRLELVLNAVALNTFSALRYG